VSDRKPWRFGAGTVIVIVLALLALTVLATRRNRTFILNQTLQLDDFFFTVVDATRLPADLGNSTPADRSSQVNYLVRLKVENRALRVPFKFSGQSLAIADAADKTALVFPRAERNSSSEPASPTLHILKAGESLTTDYLFTLPPTFDDPRLRIAPGGWSGDLLEWLIFGRKDFQLPWRARPT
jgi:hypothetical protein